MRLLGRDPTRFGRNQDIDLTRLGTPDSLIHARIDVRGYLDIKAAAGAAHRSQGGGPGFQRGLPEFMVRWVFGQETFTRAYPEPSPGALMEQDLFEGVVPHRG